jgi:pentatricopeptide repeat protein
MPAALMLRACTRLESSVAVQTWKRRTGFLTRRQNIPRVGSMYTRTYHAEAQSPFPDGGSQILSQILPRHTAPKPPETLTAEQKQVFGPRRKHERDQRSYERHNNQRKTDPRRKSTLKGTPDERFHQRRPTQLSEEARKAAEKQQQSAKEKEKRYKERYNQWGYLRHQYTGDELVAVKKQFDFWKSKIEKMAAREPISWKWKEDGKFLFELESVSEMDKVWHELDVETRKEIWPRAMLSTLHLRPDKAVQVLEATLEPLPPGYAIVDVAHACITNLKLKDIKVMRDRVAKADEVLELFAKLIEDIPQGHVPFRQHTLGYLAKNLPIEQTAEIYQILKRSGIKLHRNTLLHFASKLAGSNAHKEDAFRILRAITDEGHDLNSAGIASVITTLLHTRQEVENTWSESEDTFSPQRAMEYFLERGFSPNLVSFTALIESLCNQGDIAEAVRLPLLLAENGAELDNRCYATVFRGAKKSLKTSNVQLALDVARAAKAPYVDVLNNMLHTVFYFAEMECRDKKYTWPWVLPLFGPMLRIYAKKFDLEPLQWLLPDTLPLILTQENLEGTEKFRQGPRREWEFSNTIVPVVNEFFERDDAPRQKPTTQTLSIMLRAYIKTLSRPYDLMAFYSFFKSRLEEHGTGKNWAQKLAEDQGTVVHDTLIMVMLERKSLLRPALQVFGDMLRDTLRSKEKDEGKVAEHPESAPVHPAPSMFTFSILIHGLFMHKEKMLAEQVLQAMREHGLDLDIITWNTLARGYACMQNMSQTVGTLQDLEAAGFKPDAYTFKAFAKLRDQTRALEMMEKIIDENKKRLEQHQSQ